MNYKESREILKKVKKAKKILLNCHKGPDPDSIGSTLALYDVLRKMGKSVGMFCPTELYESVKFLKHYDKIKQSDFLKIYKEYDLFIALDSSSWDFATGIDHKPMNTPFLVVIDHHKTNERYGDINLVDANTSSLAEVLYLIFEDWDIEIDKVLATALLTGIIGDTGAFRFPGTYSSTLEIAGKLMEKGADKDGIIFHIFFSVDPDLLQFWREALGRLEFDKENKFAWTAIPKKIYVKTSGGRKPKESFATKFLQSIKGTDFGVIIVEEEKGKVNVSLRSRTGLDVSRMAVELGGGGHRYAAGGEVEGLEFDAAVEKILRICRKYSKRK